MQLHPTAPLLLPHRAKTEIDNHGYTIPKHTQVLVNVWSLALNAAYWDKPESFMPERFLGSQIDFRGKRLEFIPFGAGRRICPGLTLSTGVRMMKLLLATLIHRFDWKLPGEMALENMDMRNKFGVTLQKVVPLVAFPITN